MAETRQHEKHLHENMLRRSEAEIEQTSNQEIEEEARELMVKKRQHEEHIQENILSRSEAEINPKD
jgi:hypothetical protein